MLEIFLSQKKKSLYTKVRLGLQIRQEKFDF